VTATVALKIEGLREFQRGLKAMDKDLPKALRLAFNDAADIVVADARPRVPSRSGRAKGTVKARSTQTAARVIGGGRKAPYYPWLDFGGRAGRGAGVTRPFLADGRYIYKAFYANRSRFTDAMEEGILTVARSAGIEVT
jgi:hypothetical protein